MTISTSQPATGQLVSVIVKPYLRENLSPRQFYVRLTNTGGNLIVASGARLRKTMLLAATTTGNHRVYAAVKDEHGVWSELSPYQTVNISNFSAGSDAVSIGSGQTNAKMIEEANVLFPSFSMESGKMVVSRTIVTENAFLDRVAKQRFRVTRAAFRIKFEDLDEEETLRLHKFFQQLNGPWRPFYLDFTDPLTNEEKRHVVRFREDTISDEMFDVDRSRMEFTVVELVSHTDPVDV